MIERTNDVDLVVLPGLIALVDVNDVVSVVNAENGIGGVPVDVVALPPSQSTACPQSLDQEDGVPRLKPSSCALRATRQIN